MFNHQELMTKIRADNPHYERVLTSALHNLVEKIRTSPADVDGIVREAVKIRQDKWRKYSRTRGWLMWKAAQASRVIYMFPPICSRTGIKYRRTPMDNEGYIHRAAAAAPPPATTGIINRPRGFSWSIEVTFTLLPGADPKNYVPYRTEKSVMEYRNGAIPTLPRAVVETNAIAAPRNDDGPWFANVKRGDNTITVWDAPGTSLVQEGAVSAWQGCYPMRFCAFFQMSLLPLRDNTPTSHPNLRWNTVQTCTRGNPLPYSPVDFGIYMEKDAAGNMTGGWSNNGRRPFVDYPDQSGKAAPPNIGVRQAHVPQARRRALSGLP
jgi:hypothetical protein